MRCCSGAIVSTEYNMPRRNILKTHWDGIPLEPLTERRMLYEYIDKKDFHSIDEELKTKTFKNLGRIALHICRAGYVSEASEIYKSHFDTKKWFNEFFFGMEFDRKNVLNILYDIPAAKQKINEYVEHVATESGIPIVFQNMADLSTNKIFRDYLREDKRMKGYICWQPQTAEEYYEFS